MICPHCREEGAKSRVYTIKNPETLIGWEGPYYDERVFCISITPMTGEFFPML
jgi:hypothetical protein